MAQQIYRQQRDQDIPDPDPTDLPTPPTVQAQVSAMEEVLDAIDAVLETNAQSFVQGFVQKGGQ